MMLFGHQNDNSKQADGVINDVTAPGVSATNPLAVDPVSGISLPVPPEELEHDGSPEASVLNQPSEDALTPPPAPSDVVPDSAPVSEAPASDFVAPTPTPVPSDPVPTPSRDDLLEPSSGDDLLTLKQQALQQLSPLVSHLEQSPEEKFRTTMMMIQSSDNQALIKDAYEAAGQITDDKVRAQALLDIVNEINYFTQQAN